jgi:hypothetical protein
MLTDIDCPSLVNFTGMFDNILCCLTASQLCISNARARKRKKRTCCMSVVSYLGDVDEVKSQDKSDINLTANALRLSELPQKKIVF